MHGYRRDSAGLIGFFPAGLRQALKTQVAAPARQPQTVPTLNAQAASSRIPIPTGRPVSNS